MALAAALLIASRIAAVLFVLLAFQRNPFAAVPRNFFFRTAPRIVRTTANPPRLPVPSPSSPTTDTTTHASGIISTVLTVLAVLAVIVAAVVFITVIVVGSLYSYSRDPRVTRPPLLTAVVIVVAVVARPSTGAGFTVTAMASRPPLRCTILLPALSLPSAHTSPDEPTASPTPPTPPSPPSPPSPPRRLTGIFSRRPGALRPSSIRRLPRGGHRLDGLFAACTYHFTRQHGNVSAQLTETVPGRTRVALALPFTHLRLVRCATATIAATAAAGAAVAHSMLHAAARV